MGSRRWEGKVVLEAVHKVVIVPRFTTFIGETPFATNGLNVRRFAEATFFAWRGVDSGGNLDQVDLTIEESQDLSIWIPLGSVVTIGAGVETSVTRTFKFDWIRIVVELQRLSPPPLPDPKVTCWVVGNFVERAEPGPTGS